MAKSIRHYYLFSQKRRVRSPMKFRLSAGSCINGPYPSCSFATGGNHAAISPDNERPAEPAALPGPSP